MFDEVVEHQGTGDVQEPPALVDPPKQAPKPELRIVRYELSDE
jgi:hypothetical protein